MDDMKSAKNWYDEGVALAKQGKYEEAITYYDKSIEIKMYYATARRKRCDALAKLKRYVEALDCYDTSFKYSVRESDKFWSLRDKADLLVDLKRFEEAVEFFDKALDIDSDAPSTYRRKGVDLRKLGQYEGAIACYDRAIEIDPGYEV